MGKGNSLRQHTGVLIFYCVDFVERPTEKHWIWHTKPYSEKPEWGALPSSQFINRGDPRRTRISSSAISSDVFSRPTTWPSHVDAHLKWHNYEATTWDAERTTSCSCPNPGRSDPLNYRIHDAGNLWHAPLAAKCPTVSQQIRRNLSKYCREPIIEIERKKTLKRTPRRSFHQCGTARACDNKSFQRQRPPRFPPNRIIKVGQRSKNVLQKFRVIRTSECVNICCTDCN